VWSTDLAQLLGYVGFTLGLSAAATVGALVRLRLREGAARVPVPGWPFVPALYLAGTLGASALMALREPVVAAAGAATAAVGVPLYFVARRGVRVRRLVAPVVLAVLACVASGAGADPAAREATNGAREAARPASPAPAATASFRSAEGAFAAPFPEAPRYEEAEESTLLGRLRTRSWEVERGALRLRVERHDVPSLALLVLGADTLLGRAALELLEDLAARDPHEEPASLRGHPGRHLRYEPGDRPGETEDAWLYLLGRRLYVVFARGGDAATSAVAAHFASSVELLEE